MIFTCYIYHNYCPIHNKDNFTVTGLVLIMLSWKRVMSAHSLVLSSGPEVMVLLNFQSLSQLQPRCLVLQISFLRLLCSIHPRQTCPFLGSKLLDMSPMSDSTFNLHRTLPISGQLYPIISPSCLGTRVPRRRDGVVYDRTYVRLYMSLRNCSIFQHII